ncbi:MAG: hypothetical protein ABIS36_04270 [Chryseolinea sp.]
MYEASDDKGNVGETEHSRKYNNDTRMLADKTWKDRTAKLPVRYLGDKGTSPRQKAWYRIYSNPEESIQDWITMLISKLPLWPNAFRYKETL